jgi:hypothetical protein
MPTEKKVGTGWHRPKWVKYNCEAIELPQFSFELLDPLSLTPRRLEDLTSMDEMQVLEKFLPQIVRNHDFTHPETDEPLAQFADEPAVVKELPMFVIRFISDKFLELIGADREVVPLAKGNSS